MLPFLGRAVDRLLSRGEGLDAAGDPFGPPLTEHAIRARLDGLRAAHPAEPQGTRRVGEGARWAIVAPHYGSLERGRGLGVTGTLVAALRAEGFAVALLELPYHGSRALPGQPSGWGFVRADLGVTQTSFLDAADDAMRLARLLRAEGAQEIVGAGVSLGGCGLGLAAAHGAPLDALAFVAAVDNAASFYGTGRNRAARRRTLAAHGYDLARIEAVFAPVAPSSYPRPAARAAWAIPPHDGVVPAAWQERWRLAWEGALLPASGHGHGTALASRGVARRVAAWLSGST